MSLTVLVLVLDNGRPVIYDKGDELQLIDELNESGPIVCKDYESEREYAVLPGHVSAWFAEDQE